jgi:ABC-2 type transport system ATP-binding protein
VHQKNYNEMEKKEISIQLKNVSKTFSLSEKSHTTLKQSVFNLFKVNSSKQFKALNDINLAIHKGETIGIIGRNGSGKTTLTKIMSGSFIPDKGGEVIKVGTSLLLNLGVGYSHELTARDNIYVNGSTLGLRKKEIDVIFDDIIQFAELEEFVDVKIKNYSSGMIQRLSFSTAIYANADILFLDEVFAVGDEKFKAKAINVLEENWIKGRTAILVSHSIGLIEKYCSRTIFMEKGNMLFFGDTKTAIELYKK